MISIVHQGNQIITAKISDTSVHKSCSSIAEASRLAQQIKEIAYKKEKKLQGGKKINSARLTHFVNHIRKSLLGSGSTLVSPTYSSWIPVEYSGIHWNPLEYTYVWIFSFLSTILWIYSRSFQVVPGHSRLFQVIPGHSS